MKSTVSALSQNEREALALFYDTEAYKALIKFCELEVNALGVDALQALNIEQVRVLQGRAAFASDLVKFFKEIYKQNS